jgi:malonate decarboxylase epsilon subunit
MSILFTFPGQGAQSPGMLHRLPEHDAVRQTLREAGEVLGRDVLMLDSAEALQSTVAVQLCLLIAGVASARVLSQEAGPPDIVAGLSIGAFAAAVTADALAFNDALRLVELRGRLMEQAYPSGYGMLVVIGLEQPSLEAVLAQAHAEGHTAYLANINAEQQLVVAGNDTALLRVAELAKAAGAGKCCRLAMSVPSHCPLLDGAAAQLQAAFSGVALHTPPILYLSASAARPLREPAKLADDLAGNIARTVRWHDTTRLAYERGARLAVEMLPGTVLTGLARRVFLDGTAVALADCRLDSLSTLMQRERSAASQ